LYGPRYRLQCLVVHGIRVMYAPGTMGIPTLRPTGRKKVAFQRFNRGRKPNFRRRCDKIVYCVARAVIVSYFSGGRRVRHEAQRLKLPSRTSRTYHICFVTSLHSSITPSITAEVMQGSMQQLDYSYATTKYFMKVTIWFYLF